MKNKIFYILVMLILCIGCVYIYQIDNHLKGNRVHQHLLSQYQNHTQDNDLSFQTNLPIIQIHTNGQVIPGDPKAEKKLSSQTITGDFSLIDRQIGRNTKSDQESLNTKVMIKYRGNSSRFFDKKSYSIQLIDDQGKENKQSLVGMGAHDEWNLNGPFLDRSLLRNYLCMNIAGQIMDYAPSVRYCELFIDKEYQGLYLLMESITRGKDRVNISEPEKNRDLTSFIVRWDRMGKGNHELDNFSYYTYKSDVSALDIRYPKSKQLTNGKIQYINNEISKVEKTLYSYDLWDDKKGYTQYIDVNEFANYFVINEFFRNVDAGRFSTFYYKDTRGKIKPVVWDFNNSNDNYIDYVWDETGFSLSDAPWISRLLRDRKFVDMVVLKYEQLRKSVLSQAYLLSYIEETDTWLKDAVTRNDALYGYVYDLNNYDEMNYLTPVERNVTSHEAAIKQLKNHIVKRGNWLDAHIDSLYQYCSESKNAYEKLH